MALALNFNLHRITKIVQERKFHGASAWTELKFMQVMNDGEEKEVEALRMGIFTDDNLPVLFEVTP